MGDHCSAPPTPGCESASHQAISTPTPQSMRGLSVFLWAFSWAAVVMANSHESVMDGVELGASPSWNDDRGLQQASGGLMGTCDQASSSLCQDDLMGAFLTKWCPESCASPLPEAGLLGVSQSSGQPSNDLLQTANAHQQKVDKALDEAAVALRSLPIHCMCVPCAVIPTPLHVVVTDYALHTYTLQAQQGFSQAGEREFRERY